MTTRLRFSALAASLMLLCVSFEWLANTCSGQALVARTSISLSGNILVDSYDSSDPMFSTNGLYMASKRKDHGDILFAENTNNSQFFLGSSSPGTSGDVFGRIYYTNTLPSINLIGSVSVGDSNWVMSGNSGLQPGRVLPSVGVILPSVAVTFSTGLPLPSKSATAFQGLFYANSYMLTTGNYKQSGSFTPAATDKILISGNVKLHIVGTFSMTGNSQIIIGTNSSLTMYLSTNASFGGNGIENGTRNPTNCTVLGLDSSQVITLSGGTELYGCIYAPNASFTAVAGGAIPINICGSVIANSITASGKVQFHYDEALSPWPLFLGPSAKLFTGVESLNNSPTYYLQGLPGYSYALEFSTNLSDWTCVMTNTSPFTFTNIPLNVPQQFYRAVYLP